MKGFTTFQFVVLVVVIVVPSWAAEDSTLIQAEDRSVLRRTGVYAQRLPRMPRLRETIKNDMQQAETVYDRAKKQIVEPIVIDGGFIIFDGQYVPPPYTIRSEHGTLYINGLKVPQARPGQFFRRFANSRQTNRRFPNRGGAQIEQHLHEGGLLICTRNNHAAFVPAYQAVSVFEILLGEGSDDVKLQKLLQTDTPWIASEQWASLIKAFDGTAELSDRVQALKQHQADLAEEEPDYELHWIVLSAITFGGFILAVWAFGTLMSCRPPLLHSSRAAILSRRSCRQVIWLVILIAVLNVYDLACTLVAHNSGGLWELNPFASSIVHQNSVIVVFKVSLTVGAAILLLVARRHRLAQIGSWWAGVLYTVLILRWTMFNSMFL
jgi:hypothetical protein